MRTLQFLLICTIFSFSSIAQSKDEQQVRAVLQDQMVCWNNGDLECYMNGYWHSDSLMFIGKSGITYGWEQTLNQYQKGYPDKAGMGVLNFNLIQVKRLSAIYFMVTGRWHLTRAAGDLEGSFTLLFRKIDKKWVIVSDHSS